MASIKPGKFGECWITQSKADYENNMLLRWESVNRAMQSQLSVISVCV